MCKTTSQINLSTPKTPNKLKACNWPMSKTLISIRMIGVQRKHALFTNITTTLLSPEDSTVKAEQTCNRLNNGC